MFSELKGLDLKRPSLQTVFLQFFVGCFLMTISMLYLLEYLDLMDTAKDSV